MRSKREAAVDAFNSFLALKELMRKRDNLILQLFFHPDSTPEQILSVRDRSIQCRADYNASLKTFVESPHSRNLGYRFDLNKLRL